MISLLEKVKKVEESCKKEVEEYLRKKKEEILNLKKDYEKRIENLPSFLEPEIKKMERETAEALKKMVQENEKKLKLDYEKLKNIEEIRVQKAVALIKEEFLKSI